MKILVAPDSFKGSLKALEVARAIENGLLRANPQFEIEKLPMADGGEGTVESLVAATAGQIIRKMVTGPLGEPIEAFMGILADGGTAVIEMAAASGLPLIPEEKRNPLKTTTYGTGELIREGLDRGCRKFIIDIGGSATNDCGIGMAQALGVRFIAENGREVGYGGQELQRIQRIDCTGLDGRVRQSIFRAACDVDNPLYGERGAAYIYGPQKGATSEMVQELDQGLRHMAQIIRRDLNVVVDNLPGAGAAGGLGAGLVAFLQAELMAGIEIVLNTLRIEEKIQDIDLVITGEGMIDSQTVFGKTPIGVAQIAKKYAIPVIGVAGSLGDGFEEVYAHGVDAVFSIIDSPISLEKAMDHGAVLLERLGENIGRVFNLVIGS